MADAGDQSLIDDLVQFNVASADTRPSKAKRAQHPKHHGCVCAVFNVLDGLPEDLRHGIFARPQRFEAWVRFSNGRVDDDRRADAHGMAIKLLGVPGDKLTGVAESEHDFIMVDSETFFTGDLSDYLMINRGAVRSSRNPLHAAFFWPWMFLFHRSLLMRTIAFVNHSPVSPLAIRYFSGVPYRLGHRAVKYVVRPRLAMQPPGRLASPNGLATALVDRLSYTDASFDFGVDVQTDADAQPIEDPTVSWSTQRNARREWLAVIEIPRQDVDPHSHIAEDIAFSPWRVSEEHQPLGAINRARQPIYRDMSTLRHDLNDVAPTGSQSPETDLPANS